MSIYLGIDSGTQSCKAVALDLDSGKVIAEARAPHALISGLPIGHMEQNPSDWTTALDATIGEVASKIDRTRVRGIGVSGQQHGFVPLDKAGKVIRPAKLWCDTSTQKECEILTQRLGGSKATIRKIGLAMLPGFTAPKVLWLKRHEPKNFRKLRHILLPHDYLNYYLTGEFFMEHGDASGSALMNVRTRKWSAPALKAIDDDVAGFLPKLSSSDAIVGTLRPAVAQKYGFPADVIVSAGGGDNMMGAIGTGNVKPGVVTASFGTSGTIYAHVEEPVVDPAGEIAAFCGSTGGWLPLLCTMNVTTVTEQVRSLFDLDHAALGDAISSAPVGADGLVMLPYLEGERTPNVPTGSGVYLGLNQNTFSRNHLARAAMEGVTMGMNYGLQRLAGLGVKPKEIRVTGGGAKSPVWRQIMADVLDVPVVAVVGDEGAALGGAIQAAWADARQRRSNARISPLTDRLGAKDETSRPKAQRSSARRYQQLQQVHDELSQSLRKVFALQRAHSTQD